MDIGYYFKYLNKMHSMNIIHGINREFFSSARRYDGYDIIVQKKNVQDAIYRNIDDDDYIDNSPVILYCKRMDCCCVRVTVTGYNHIIDKVTIDYPMHIPYFISFFMSQINLR